MNRHKSCSCESTFAKAMVEYGGHLDVCLQALTAHNLQSVTSNFKETFMVDQETYYLPALTLPHFASKEWNDRIARWPDSNVDATHCHDLITNEIQVQIDTMALS